MGNSSETQDRILDTAIRHFAKKGYHGTKTADIAKDSGVSEGTVFKYYSTKKDILRSVLNKIVHEIIPGIMFESTEDFQNLASSADAKQEIKGFIKSKVVKVNENISAFKILVNELPFHEDIMNEYVGQFIPKVIKMAEGFYGLGVAKGIFRDINPHTAVRSFIGMLATVVLEGNVLKKSLDVDKELDVVLDIFMNGICVKKEG
ncbi:MAG TPA: TetR/AcrR family transcriptional regulator [Clostridia bacterium]|nr:TetR/AcrR family transcriptional regulator [Clostridia bacterium]